MVSAHVWMRAYSVGAATQTPGAQVRYLQREGEFAPVSYVERTSTKTKDYGDYVTGGVRNLPDWAEGDAARFFTQAAQHERRNGYYAFQMEFSLPRELTHSQQMALTTDLLEATMPDLPALWVKHDKRLEHGEMHPHIHVLFSARKHDGIPRSPAQTFARWNRAHPERGGAEKDLFWSQCQAPEQLRHAFADLTNYHLERANALERVDARALKRRGSQRRAIRWDHTERPDAHVLAREQAQAQTAWEQRKAYQGFAHVQTISRDAFVLRVRHATREYEPGTELPRSHPDVVRAWHEQEYQKREHALRGLDAYRTQLAQARAQEQRYTARRWEPPLAVRAQSERVLAEARTHGLAPDLEAERAMHVLHLHLPDLTSEYSTGRAARARVFDERREDRRRDRDGYDRP